MSLIAAVQNPLKKFAYKVIVAGLETALVQKVKMPDQEVDVVKHGNYNMDVATAGKLKYGDLTLDKLVSADGITDLWAWSWLMTVQNPIGLGGVAPVYKQTVIVQLIGPDGVSIKRQWMVEGAFVKKVEGEDLDAMSSENIIEKVVLSCDYVIPL
jgi:phage tail-like protein